MRNLRSMIQDADPFLRPVFAGFWGVDLRKLTDRDAIDALSTAMQDPARAEKVWDGLDDDQRGVLQSILASDGRMQFGMFTRLFGEIRRMGASEIEREQPHLRPASSAEALYYRGLIARAFSEGTAGAVEMIYVPTDLIPVLPSHRTAYDNLDDVPDEPMRLEAIDTEADAVQQADTSIVDDMTTLLAYLQLHNVAVSTDTLAADERADLLPHLLARVDVRLDFLFALALSAGLVEVVDGRAVPRRADTRRWLADTRAVQVQQLTNAWRTSSQYRDLWHVPGLHPEPAGWPYDPTVPRSAMINFLGELAPEQGWWSIDEFIETVKAVDPDFQRPGGDYNSWYIRNDNGDYLQGFESWDAVDGALLEYYLLGPMHWLGLVDLAEDSAHLTAYGRAAAGQIAWPTPADPEDSITVEADGTLLVSRRISRLDRFQVARFTTWEAAGDPYRYRLDGRGIMQADQQGINTGHITAFLKRVAPVVPPAITTLLDSWQSGPTASVTLEQVVVLRTTAPETLTMILENPALRRYVGAQLGPMAVIVRRDQWQALRDALGGQGIDAEWIE